MTHIFRREPVDSSDTSVKEPILRSDGKKRFRNIDGKLMDTEMPEEVLEAQKAYGRKTKRPTASATAMGWSQKSADQLRKEKEDA